MGMEVVRKGPAFGTGSQLNAKPDHLKFKVIAYRIHSQKKTSFVPVLKSNSSFLFFYFFVFTPRSLSFLFIFKGLSKVQLPTAFPCNSYNDVPQAIRSYINCPLWSGYQMCAPCTIICSSSVKIPALKFALLNLNGKILTTENIE